MIEEIHNMSYKDKERLLQCVFCTNDPEICGCTEKDEDNRGLCKHYKCKYFKAREDGTE